MAELPVVEPCAQGSDTASRLPKGIPSSISQTGYDRSDSWWTWVDIADRGTGRESEGDGSVVAVSRPSSPLTVEFSALRLAGPSLRIPWPATLPWFQFRDRYLDDATLRGLLAQRSRDSEVVSGESSKRSMVLSSMQIKSLSTPGGARRMAAEISKFMPESCEGENIARVQAMTRGDALELRHQDTQLFVYQLSNNLIQDDGCGYLNKWRNRFTKTIDMFHSLDLPLITWKQYFAQSRGEATSSAFIEKLFEAAVNTESLGLCEGLLESGADPDKIIYSAARHGLVRPIQHAMEPQVRDANLAKLLVRFKARVELTTKEHECPALLEAAENGKEDGVRVLVEAGADIRVIYTDLQTQNWISHDTVLSRTADADRRWSHPDGKGDDGCRDLTSLSCLKYLLPMYDQERDHGIIQSALLVSASRHRQDMIPILVEAGGDVNETNIHGYTPLMTAVRTCDGADGISAVRMLLNLGADPDRPFGHSSPLNVRPLHIAAACGSPELIELLLELGADVDARAVPRPMPQGTNLHFDVPNDASCPVTPLMLVLSTTDFKNLTRGRERAAVALRLLRAGASLIGGELPRAAHLGSGELLHELLDRGANVNETDRAGKTALQNSICFLTKHLAADLLAAGAEIRGGELEKAIRIGSRDTVDALLRHGASIDHETGTRSVVAAAAASHNWNLMLWLMETHSVPYHPAALCAAVCSGRINEECLVALINHRDLDNAGGLLTATAIGAAAYREDEWALDHLLKFKTQTTCLLPLRDDATGYHTLSGGWESSLYDQYETDFWKRKGHMRFSVLVPPIFSANWDAVRRLLDAGHKPDRLSLFVAAVLSNTHDFRGYWDAEEVEEHEKESLDLVLSLTKLMKLRDISQPARRGLHTPLQAAVKSRRPDVARHLLTLGADVNAPVPKIVDAYIDPDDVVPPRTALQAAVENGDVEMIDLLLDAGADVCAPAGYDSGATAVQLAAGNGHIGIARRLVSLGADVGAAGARRRGRTALQAAAEGGRVDMVQFLLECGAGRLEDATIEPRLAYSRARRLARRNGHVAAEGLLQAHEERLAVAGGTEVSGTDCSGLDDSDLDSLASYESGSASEDEGGHYAPEQDISEEQDDEGYGEYEETY